MKHIEEQTDIFLIEKYKNSLIYYSNLFWQYLGYSSSLKPWHESPYAEHKLMNDKFMPSIVALLKYLELNDITFKSYAAFTMPLMLSNDFVNPARLYSGLKKTPKAWVTKLRNQVSTSDDLDLAANCFLKFQELQIKDSGVVKINNVLQAEKKKSKGKRYELYHRLIERVLSIRDFDVDPYLWVEHKFRNVLEFSKRNGHQNVSFSMFVNNNGLEPNLLDLKNITNDPWRELRDFLGLSSDCKFVDGYIPKGWSSSSDDRDDLAKVVKVTGLGYYYYANGIQRRGKRHYAQNSYFVIKCTPENFNLFKDSWHDPRLLSASPTWEEYSKWAVNSDWWDEQGESINGRSKSVKWRK